MLRTLNLPDHDPLINEMFSDFDETIFPWMTDGFDPLPDANLSNDDLLTDAVSEMLKCKTELTCSDFPNSSENFSDVVVGDEVEINATILAGSTHQGVVGKHHVDSSGYTSGNLSSTYLSPSNSTSSQVASPLSVDVTQPSNLPNSSIKVSSDYPMQRKNILQASLFKRSDEASEPPILTSKRTFNKRDFTPGNRVHLILHNNPSSIKFSNKGSDLERGKPGTLYLNKTLSHPSDFVYPCSDEKRFTESPMFNGSHSSSDSDMKYNSDDDQMINPAYAKYEDTFGHEHVQQPRSSTNLTRAVGTFKRTASPISKLSHFKYGFDEETGYNYQHTARLFRSQLSSSRIRSPIRLDRNDSGLVMLTSEEKRTLIAEGYTIPTRMPLTKQEERNLKKVRRKIKNKISAQESRRKKKEYLESLERKVSVYSQENVELRRRVDGLENTNRSLLGQLRLLQQLVSKSKNSVTSTPVKSSFTISPSNNNNTHPTVSGHKPPAGHQQQQQQRQCAPGNGLVSASAATGASGDSEGGPSSTCLMVFALCFVALLVGQPLQPVSQSTTGTALSSVTSQIFTSSLLGSPSQVGYSWSPPSSHRSKSRPGQTHLFQSTWLARQYFHWMGSSRGLQKHDHLAASTCSVEAGIEAGPTWTDGMVNPDGVGSTEGASPQTGGSTGSQPMVMGEWKSEPRSRLLGSPSELAECSAPPRRTTFWSSLFGGSETAGVPKSTMGGICTQLEYGDPGTLDSVTGNYWPPGPVRSLSRESVARFGRQHLNRSTVDSDQLPYSADQDATSPNLSTAFISANMTLMSA